MGSLVNAVVVDGLTTVHAREDMHFKTEDVHADDPLMYIEISHTSIVPLSLSWSASHA